MNQAGSAGQALHAQTISTPELTHLHHQDGQLSVVPREVCLCPGTWTPRGQERDTSWALVGGTPGLVEPLCV